MRREPTLEEAQKVMADYPEQDDYVQAHYQQFLTNGEHDDNTVEAAIYWNKCKKITGEQTTQNKNQLTK